MKDTILMFVTSPLWIAGMAWHFVRHYFRAGIRMGEFVCDWLDS